MSGLQPHPADEARPNRSIRKTRHALADALMAAITEKPYKDVTVQDVIDRADVARSTFYAHFVDKDSLLVEALRLRRGQHVEATPIGEDRRDEAFGWSLGMFDWSLAFARGFSCAEPAYRASISDPSCVLAVQEMEHELDDLVRRDLAQLARRSPEGVPDVVVLSVVKTFMSVMTWWLEHPDALTPDEVDAIFRTLAVPGASAALGVPVTPDAPPAALGRLVEAALQRG